MKRKISILLEALAWIMILIGAITISIVVTLNKVTGITYLLAWIMGLLIGVLIIKRIIS